jgi:hypothetical protein
MDHNPFKYDRDENRRRRGPICCVPGNTERDTWRRCVFNEGGEGYTIYAWPGNGVVIKQNADVVDMTFLGFNRFDPPTHREKEK